MPVPVLRAVACLQGAGLAATSSDRLLTLHGFSRPLLFLRAWIIFLDCLTSGKESPVGFGYLLCKGRKYFSVCCSLPSHTVPLRVVDTTWYSHSHGPSSGSSNVLPNFQQLSPVFGNPENQHSDDSEEIKVETESCLLCPPSPVLWLCH